MKRSLLFVVILALVTTGASCPTPRHTATVNISVMSHAIGGLQDTVVILCNTQVIKDAQKCRDAGEVFKKIWTYDRETVEILLAWKPGQPIPKSLAGEITAIRGLVQSLALDTIPASAPKVVAVYDSITAVLMIMFGGAA